MCVLTSYSNVHNNFLEIKLSQSKKKSLYNNKNINPPLYTHTRIYIYIYIYTHTLNIFKEISSVYICKTNTKKLRATDILIITMRGLPHIYYLQAHFFTV